MTKIFCSRIIIAFAILMLQIHTLAQTNDNCNNAAVVNISDNGFGTGIFTSAVTDISSATVQTGETFAPAIMVAGQIQKSVWYKFSIPTTRAVRVTLAQNGSAIAAGNIGFAVYKTSSCLPGNTEISTKLTPIGLFGNTYHPCVEAGEYLVQVSAKAAANGPIYIEVETSFPTADYDKPENAYDFGTLAQGVRMIDYTVNCQSIENENETCTALYNYQRYNKTSWHVFKTPAYFDYLAFLFGQPSNNVNGIRIGYKLYKGDVRTNSYATLPQIGGCDSIDLSTSNYIGEKIYKCDDLEKDTYYSIQLFFAEDFVNDVRVGMSLTGLAPTQAPRPVLADIPSPSNALGILPSSSTGVTTTVYDQLGCNSRFTQNPCSPALPADGVVVNNNTYNLSTFFTFTLSKTSNIYFSGGFQGFSCGQQLYFRLYNQTVSADCSTLDTANIVSAFNYGKTLQCLPAGTYTIQVLGQEKPYNVNYSAGNIYNTTTPLCLIENLGARFSLSMNVKEIQAINDFSLSAPGAFDSINAVNGNLAALTPGVQYNSKVDTFGCANTVLPWDTTCAPVNTKAVYREFLVADSGIIRIRWNNGNYSNQWMKLYAGDANAMATSQNVFSYPQEITGIDPVSKCISGVNCSRLRTCVLPGTYTDVSFGYDGNISQTNSKQYELDTVKTRFYNPDLAEDLGDLYAQLPGGGSKTATKDFFTCRDNAVAINGYQPCTMGGQPATKAIYRMFYLSQASNITISGYHYSTDCGYTYGGRITLFRGKATEGLNTLTVMPSPWQCFQSASANGCTVLEPGWYTMVSYGNGPGYDNPLQGYDSHGDLLGLSDMPTITINPGCPGPKFNRPHKASVDTLTGQPYLLQWGPRVGHTSAYPKTDTTIKLHREYFNCTLDTPFVSHPIVPCNTSVNRVVYYVFRTTQISYVQINTFGLWGAVFAGDARTDSASFATATPIQECRSSHGQIQICKMEPGTYTLVLFAGDNQNCQSVEPTIYIDQVGVSRFDHAINAYDFGVVPADSTFHYGKPGDVNPLDPGRKPVSDIFYCTTGAQQQDPTGAACHVDYLPSIYNEGNNNALYGTSTQTGHAQVNTTRRNLWYSFVLNQGGNIRIRIDNKTPGKQQMPFAFSVYKSDADGSLSFADLVAAGEVDSTLAQGLTLVTTNLSYSYYCYTTPEADFYRDPCKPNPERYYIMVEVPSSYYWGGNNGAHQMQPNNQVEVAILVDSVNAIMPKFDHYFQASNIGSNLGTGSFTGETDNYSCATKDITDPVYAYGSCATKTLWYKFSTTVTGKVRYRVQNNNTSQYYLNYIQIYKEIIPGDSTTNGLQLLNQNGSSVYDEGKTWAQTCLSPGTYYILLTGCNMVNEFATPHIKIIEEAGDFCSAPVIASLSTSGTSVTTLTVDCHTIGTDYGEFNPTLTCPDGAPRQNYKTSWFRLDITGTDTLDVTTYLTENTNALPSQIKYRMMNGDCGAMQEQSCVQDAQTQDTYKCLLPGHSYYFQVFTPVTNNNQPVVGSISLNLSAVPHADTCAPVQCLSNAMFMYEYDCTLSDYVSFVNYSTYGTSVQYEWNFGDGSPVSGEVAPVHRFPVLNTAQTYTVTLTVTNNACTSGDNQSTYTQQITIPPRPDVSLGDDTTFCTSGSSLALNAETWTGTTYQWSTGSTQPSITASQSGSRTYWVQATYNGCIKRDTIVVNINPFTGVNQSQAICSAGGSYTFSNNMAASYPDAIHSWSNGVTTYYNTVTVPGTYYDDIYWRGCTIRDTFTLALPSYPFNKKDTVVCYPMNGFQADATSAGATSYSWFDGSSGPVKTLNDPGTYWVDVNYPGCSIRDTIYVSEADAPVTEQQSVNACYGQLYQLPWGLSVSESGTYNDTLYNEAGCDSLIHSVEVLFTEPVTESSDVYICEGQTHILPWGEVTGVPGIYRDTIYSIAGCDSVYQVVDLSIYEVVVEESEAVICHNQTYTLPWGDVVSTPGIYSDTIAFTSGGCDSIIRHLTLVVKPVYIENEVISVCAGSSYTLPWGETVSTSGLYADTILYANGCDSLIHNVQLHVLDVTEQSQEAWICQGEVLTLPWGDITSEAGIFHDTLFYVNGCDSVRNTVTVQIRDVILELVTDTLCSGGVYQLPWGGTAGISGVYSDTIPYTSADCDSLIRIVDLTVLATITADTTVSICEGGSYPLPWGEIVNDAGLYSDTILYTNGCDSLIRNIQLQILSVSEELHTVSICEGQSFTLPWGSVVDAPGIYSDTLYYQNGCDSVRIHYDLGVLEVITEQVYDTICSGVTYQLPWGADANTSGIYTNTIPYTNSNCDSLIRIVDLTVLETFIENASVSICQGSSYQLPWGGLAGEAGVYSDTLYYANGCDSLITQITVAVETFQEQFIDAVICEGGSYALPWGVTVSDAGVYSDTSYYASGCISQVVHVNLVVQTSTTETTDAFICEGQQFNLPWGSSVSLTGEYRDTLFYATGCDSLIRVVNLTVYDHETELSDITICQGQQYTLPWGDVAVATGVYSNTWQNFVGCDSVTKIVNLTVIPAVITQIAAEICSDEFYTLPWGEQVNTGGIYRDTVITAGNCISEIRIVDLTVNPVPHIQLTKSNDINCNIGLSRLTASGGVRYEWKPAATLNRVDISNPVATPDTTTWYSVQVTTDKGCSAKDSILVLVDWSGREGFLVPNAFTPNGDGLNDCFGVKHWGAVKDFEMHVFNRWGQLMFHTTDPNRCWDGTYANRQLGTNAFVYVIKATTNCGPVLRKGTVVLVR